LIYQQNPSCTSTAKAYYLKKPETRSEKTTLPESEAKPRFASRVYVYRAAPNFGVGGGVFTQMPFQTTLFDGLGEYTAAPAFSWTPRRAGYYLVTVSIAWSAIPVGEWLEIVVRIQPPLRPFGHITETSVAGDVDQRMSFIVYVTPTENLTVWVQPLAAETVNANPYNTTLQIHRLS
jgi:hypothetical protein